MDAQVNGGHDHVETFRTRLLTDPQFRRTFVSHPEATARAHGIPLPADARIGPIDADAFDVRVRKQTIVDAVNGAISEAAFAALASDPAEAQRLQTILNANERRIKLAFYFTLTCNARCEHCHTDAGPQVAQKMSLEDARALVASVARFPRISGVVFTGGENLLHKNDLLQLVRDCRELGLQSEIVTNGFWGATLRGARELLASLREAGLGGVVISIDRFHLPYIPAARVHTALQALEAEGFRRHITCVVDPEEYFAGHKPSTRLVDTADPDAVAHWDEAYAGHLTRELQRVWPPQVLRLLQTYGFDLSTCLLHDDNTDLFAQSWPGAKPLAEYFAQHRTLVQYRFLLTEGRARTLIGAVPDLSVDDLPETPCKFVMASPCVTPGGHMFPCNSSWAHYPVQAIGRVQETAFPDLMKRVRSDRVVLFMSRQGPAALMKYLRARGDGPLVDRQGSRAFLRMAKPASALPDRYGHPCHVCGTLLETYSRAELEDAISSYYADHPSGLPESIIDLLPPSRVDRGVPVDSSSSSIVVG